MVSCPSCGTEMREAFKGETLVYYVCGSCGVSKMDVEPAAIPPMNDPQPKQTGLVCVRCNQPYAVIENEGPDKFILHCQRCDHRWTVPTSDRKPVSDIH